MIHLGDITKISGYEAPIVDCVVGGSPCQNLSVAGNREGLSGEESHLFHEQIRIIKEMRERDARNGRTNEHIRPRYMVWENVPGAFSSNKGEDFRIVLEETAKVIDKDAVIPMPEKNKWHTSGCILGDGWSIAWRVFDAQFWGVPQRRRRITLVADFGGESASEILFIRKSMSRDTDESGTKRKGTFSDLQRSIGVYDSGGIAYTMQERAGCEGGGKGALIQADKSASLRCGNWQTLFQPIKSEVIAFDRSAYNQGENAKFDIGIDESGIAHSLVAKGPGGVAYGIDPSAARDVGILFIKDKSKTLTNGSSPGHHCGVVVQSNNTARVRYIVRRLTPLECERLQGFPDGWTDIGEYINSKGKKCKTSDAARYKALGNSIALPSWRWVVKRISACYERTPTMCSLFDGIGGFPLIWEQINGKGTCIWSSEIEDFPDAVTRKRIGE
jgi:DNA (cytosine-5)-methyltransferase 1